MIENKQIPLGYCKCSVQTVLFLLIILIVIIQEPQVHTTIEDAFDTVLQYMNVTSRQCKVMIYKVEWNKVSVLLYKVAFNCLDTCREWEQTDIWYWIIIAVVSFVN